jgi:hypothetical protein
MLAVICDTLGGHLIPSCSQTIGVHPKMAQLFWAQLPHELQHLEFCLSYRMQLRSLPSSDAPIPPDTMLPERHPIIDAGHRCHSKSTRKVLNALFILHPYVRKATWHTSPKRREESLGKSSQRYLDNLPQYCYLVLSMHKG